MRNLGCLIRGAVARPRTAPEVPPAGRAVRRRQPALLTPKSQIRQSRRAVRSRSRSDLMRQGRLIEQCHRARAEALATGGLGHRGIR
jgi:hypothetical protein